MILLTHTHTHFCHMQRIGHRVLRYLMLCCLRTFLVLISWGVAIGIPRFELCLALVGSFATSVLAFILPPLFHVTLFWSYGPNWRNVFHIILLNVGILVTILATAINLYMAIKHYSPSTGCKGLLEQCHKTFNEYDSHCYDNDGPTPNITLF